MDGKAGGLAESGSTRFRALARMAISVRPRAFVVLAIVAFAGTYGYVSWSIDEHYWSSVFVVSHPMAMAAGFQLTSSWVALCVVGLALPWAVLAAAHHVGDCFWSAVRLTLRALGRWLLGATIAGVALGFLVVSLPYKWIATGIDSGNVDAFSALEMFRLGFANGSTVFLIFCLASAAAYGLQRSLVARPRVEHFAYLLTSIATAAFTVALFWRIAGVADFQRMCEYSGCVPIEVLGPMARSLVIGNCLFLVVMLGLFPSNSRAGGMFLRIAALALAATLIVAGMASLMAWNWSSEGGVLSPEHRRAMALWMFVIFLNANYWKLLGAVAWCIAAVGVFVQTRRATELSE